jgi:hypothetical protein
LPHANIRRQLIYDLGMRNPIGVALLVLPLFFCSLQTTRVPVAPAGSALVVSTPALDVPSAKAGGPASPALLQQRADAAGQALQNSLARYQAGSAPIDEIGAWSEHLFAAQREVLAGTALSDAAKERVSQMKKLEALASQRVSSGTAPSSETAKATYFRASAEIDLARL